MFATRTFYSLLFVAIALNLSTGSTILMIVSAEIARRALWAIWPEAMAKMDSDPSTQKKG
jgi:hypothetical protein